MELSRHTWRLSIYKATCVKSMDRMMIQEIIENRKYVDFDILIVATSEITRRKVSCLLPYTCRAADSFPLFPTTSVRPSVSLLCFMPLFFYMLLDESSSYIWADLAFTHYEGETMLNFMEARYEKILIDRSKGVLYNVPATVLTE
jgi:hypothetical protein